MKRWLIINLLFFIITGYSSEVFCKSQELMTKDDFKIFVEMINKRFDDVNKRFDMITWVMGIGFSALAFFSLFLYRLTNKRFEQMDKRFEESREEVNKRFEQVDAVLLLLVKAHEKEIGSRVIDLTMGRIGLKEVTDEMIEEVGDKVEKKNEKMIENIIKRIKPIIKKQIEHQIHSMNLR